MLKNTKLKRQIGEALSIDELILDLEEFLLVHENVCIVEFIKKLLQYQELELKKSNDKNDSR